METLTVDDSDQGEDQEDVHDDDCQKETVTEHSQMNKRKLVSASKSKLSKKKFVTKKLVKVKKPKGSFYN